MDDVFRRAYREISQEEKNDLENIKNQAEILFNIVNVLQNKKNCREYSIAKTKIEEAVMWAVKGITG